MGKRHCMTPARLARADLVAPPLELVAAGALEVSGSADLPARSGPPRPRSPDAPELSHARAALRHHHEHLGRLAAEVARAQRPVARLQTLLGQAVNDLAAASARQNRADAVYAQEVAQAAREGDEVVLPPPAVSTENQAAIEQARASCNGYRLALEECRGDQERASAALEQANARGEELLLNVLVEQHHERLATWAAAHEKAVVAEQLLLSLHEFVGEHGRALEQKQAGRGITWLRALEQMRARPPGAVAARELGPRDIMNGAAQWASVLERLKTDPTASL